MLELIGLIIFNVELSDDFTYSNMHTVLASLMVSVWVRGCVCWGGGAQGGVEECGWLLF